MGLGDSLRRRRHGPGAEAVREESGDELESLVTPEPPSRPDRRPRGAAVFVLALLVVLAGSFGVGYLLATRVLFPPPETAGAGVPVPALYGQPRAEAEEAIRALGLEIGDVTEVASLERDAGTVLAQAPLPGQQLHAGATVSFAVSSGPPVLRVPPVRGLGVETATALLERAGFEVAVQQVESDVPEGLVAEAAPAAGSERTLPTVVTLQVSVGPPADAGADTVTGALPPQATAGAGRPASPAIDGEGW